MVVMPFLQIGKLCVRMATAKVAAMYKTRAEQEEKRKLQVGGREGGYFLIKHKYYEKIEERRKRVGEREGGFVCEVCVCVHVPQVP